MDPRTETRSIESHAVPTDVLALLADPTRLPEWAPAFADTIVRDAANWRATKDGRDFDLDVLTHPEAGTVDYQREIAPGRKGGAYLRVVPRPGGGSVITMTLPIAPGSDPAVVERTLREELDALVGLVEGG